MQKLKVLELFAGIGACSKALERQDIAYEIIDAVEIDKYAIESFNAIHNTNFETQDITNWNKDIEIDLIMHGSPCQDFSVAGKQAGGDEGTGTRSSLMYETLRIVKKLKPKYIVWENVRNILSKTHKHNFDNYIEKMKELGYNSYYQVLNSKDYGIPQNRERIFTISIRKDLKQSYIFPPKQELKLRLKDMLENNVDEKYYLSSNQIQYLEYGKYENAKVSNKLKQTDTGICPTLDTMQGGNRQPLIKTNINDYMIIGSTQNHASVSENGIVPTLTNMQGGNRQPKILIKNNTKQGYLEAEEGDGIYTNISTKRGTVQKQMVQTLTSFQDKGVIIGSTQKHSAISENGIVPTLTSAMGVEGGHIPMHNYDLKIRKLTPLECWRLQGFDDEDFYKAKERLNKVFYKGKDKSNSQLYKQAGNSITVNVLEKIFKNLFKKDEVDLKC